MQKNLKDMIRGRRKGLEGLGRGGGGLGVRKKCFQGVCRVGKMGGVGWWGAGSLHGAAPSRWRLPRESGSLQRPYNQGVIHRSAAKNEERVSCRE